MISQAAILLADAVMYEGAFLYPYRKSSLKNRYRWTFGTIAARGAGAASELTASCLVRGADEPVEVLLRFLTEHADGALAPRALTEEAGDGVHTVDFSFDGVSGALVLERTRLGAGYARLRVCVQNRSEPSADAPATRSALHGVHTLLHVQGSAHFVSLTDPPPEAQPYAALCEGRGLWCAVLGADRVRPDTVLAAPVILPDFASVAPESCAELCDATEIDELLTLRIRTLTQAEKREARAGDGWVRDMLDRVDSLTQAQLARLHGATRSPAAQELRGARVVLQPRRSADAIDMLLHGRSATVRGVERSVDGEVLLTVTVDDDPGSDLGASGLPGHRFFFGLDEVKLVEP